MSEPLKKGELPAIERFTLFSGALTPTLDVLTKKPSGEWVRAADYDALASLLSDEVARAERARATLRWILTDAVYKPPECLRDPVVTQRWLDAAKIALEETEPPK